MAQSPRLACRSGPPSVRRERLAAFGRVRGRPRRQHIGGDSPPGEQPPRSNGWQTSVRCQMTEPASAPWVAFAILPSGREVVAAQVAEVAVARAQLARRLGAQELAVRAEPRARVAPAGMRPGFASAPFGRAWEHESWQRGFYPTSR